MVPLSRRATSETEIPGSWSAFIGIEPYLWAVFAIILSIVSVRGFDRASLTILTSF